MVYSSKILVKHLCLLPQEIQLAVLIAFTTIFYWSNLHSTSTVLSFHQSIYLRAHLHWINSDTSALFLEHRWQLERQLLLQLSGQGAHLSYQKPSRLSVLMKHIGLWSIVMIIYMKCKHCTFCLHNIFVFTPTALTVQVISALQNVYTCIKPIKLLPLP